RRKVLSNMQQNAAIMTRNAAFLTRAMTRDRPGRRCAKADRVHFGFSTTRGRNGDRIVGRNRCRVMRTTAAVAAGSRIRRLTNSRTREQDGPDAKERGAVAAATFRPTSRRGLTAEKTHVRGKRGVRILSTATIPLVKRRLITVGGTANTIDVVEN